MKHRKAADLVSFAVHELDESRSMRAGLLQLTHTEDRRHQGIARKALVDGDAEAAARVEWLRDRRMLRRAGIKKLLHAWHDTAALAAVDAWPLGHYDAEQHPEAIHTLDDVVAEIHRRYPELHALLRAKCEAENLSPLLYANLSPGARSKAARLAVSE